MNRSPLRFVPRFVPRLVGLIAVALAVLVAPALPAGALDDVDAGVVVVEEYECDPTKPPTKTNPCPEPADCTDQPAGQPCRRVCVDPDDIALCLWHTPGGYRADLDGACVGWVGDHTQLCVNGFDGCAVTVTGARLQCG